MSYFLKLIRWQNLLIIALTQCVFRFGFFNLKQFSELNFFTALTTGQFFALVFATLSLAAAGYIINDVYDVETDAVNKAKDQIIGKHINESLATNLFVILNILGVVLGFYVSNSIGKNVYAAFFVIISVLLYFYATYLKGTVLIGNIVVSALVASTILIVGVFELTPLINPDNKDFMLYIFKFFLEFSCFAFLVNLVREMVKDIQDVDGDHSAGLQTLPIVIGRNRAAKITFVVSLLPIIATIYYLITYLYNNSVLMVYFLLLIIGPLLFISIKILSAESKKDFKLISLLLKLVMVTGIFSILLF